MKLHYIGVRPIFPPTNDAEAWELTAIYTDNQERKQAVTRVMRREGLERLLAIYT